MQKRLPRISISTRNPIRLELDDGRPFFALGDTAWELFHRLEDFEITRYLRVRSNQNFALIWAVLLPEFDGLRTPNRAGLVPLDDMDPSKPNEEYFDFVLAVVRQAAKMGLYFALLPTWGDKVTDDWGEGPVIFRQDNLDVAFNYGSYLAKKFKDESNLIWVLGGDRPAWTQEKDWTMIWRAMADGLRQTYKFEGAPCPLMTYHPQGGWDSTSVKLSPERWLDINAIQSGHGGGHDEPIWQLIERDLQMTPRRPTMDVEPNYEQHPVNPWPIWDPDTGRFSDYDVRKQTYRSAFSGGCGVTYGHHSVWQFYDESRSPILNPNMDWMTALASPGAESMKYLRFLMECEGADMRKAPSIILNNGHGGDRAAAMRDKESALVYQPTKRPLAIGLGWAPSDSVEIVRIDPLTGKRETYGHFSTSRPATISGSDGQNTADSVYYIHSFTSTPATRIESLREQVLAAANELRDDQRLEAILSQ